MKPPPNTPPRRPGQDQSPKQPTPTPTGALVDNVDALWRDLNNLDTIATAALAGNPVEPAALAGIEANPRGLGYEELTTLNDTRRAAKGWGEADLLALVDVNQRVALQGWSAADATVVALAGTVGVLATVFDKRTDAAVREGLKWVKHTDLIRDWEKQTARLPIDYTGPRFGGAAHRVRSGGHDIARIFEAISQIRDGEFRGVWWDDNTKTFAAVTETRSGAPFKSAPDPLDALALLVKHLAADVVTPMSLPLPGWTLLLEMPSDTLRQFAFAAYSGTKLGEGLNMRSGLLTPQLGIVITELIIRTHTHLTAYQTTGTFTLTPAETAKQGTVQ